MNPTATPKPEALRPEMGVGFSLDESTYLRNLVLMHQKHVAQDKTLAYDKRQESLKHMKVVIDKLEQLIADATKAAGPKS